MGWKKILGDAKGKIDDYQEKRRLENEEQERIDALDSEKVREYTNKINELLDKFEISNFESFIKRYLNIDKPSIQEHNKKTDTTYERPLARKEYIANLWWYLNNQEISFEHLKDFALKTRIVAPSFFGMESKGISENRDFENIINSIKADFQPEKITDEKELQSQLTIFIRAKFPELKLEREVNLNGDDKRFWLGRLVDINDNKSNNSTSLNPEFFPERFELNDETRKVIK